MSIISEESGEPMPRGSLAEDTMAVFVFEHAVNLATGLLHVQRQGEKSPTESTRRECRREVVERFWKLADRELFPR